MSLPTGLSYSGYNGALTQVSGGGNGTSGTLVDGRSSLMNQIARRLKGLGGLRLRVIMRALNEGGSGQAITGGSYTRRVAVLGIDQGGKILMESTTIGGASGNTAAGDVTEVKNKIYNAQMALAPSSYPADKSGNGGGDKGKY